MPAYRKKAATVEAVQFTRELAQAVQAFHADEANKGKTHESGVTHEEGRGFKFRDKALGFGDYIVSPTLASITVKSAKDFEAEYEVV